MKRVLASNWSSASQRPLVEQFVVHRLRLPPERHQRQQHQRGRHQGDLKIAPVQKPSHENRQSRAQHRRQHDEHRDQHRRHHIKMPRHAAHQTERRQQRRDQKQKRPRRQQRGLDEFPAEDGLRRDRQRQQKNRLAVAEQVGVADDEVAQQQQREEKREQREKQSLGEHRAEPWKFCDELHAVEKQLERHNKVTRNEKTDDAGQQPRLSAHGQQPPPTVQRVHAHEQPERGGHVWNFEWAKLSGTRENSRNFLCAQ